MQYLDNEFSHFINKLKPSMSINKVKNAFSQITIEKIIEEKKLNF